VTASTSDATPVVATQAAPSAEVVEQGMRALRVLRAVKVVVLVGLLVVGLVGGVFAYRYLNPGIDYGKLPPLTEAAEPPAADDLTDLVVAGDEAKLAQKYDSGLLESLSMALTVGAGSQPPPLVDIQDIRYLGSVAQGGDTLAMYVAVGQLDGGTPAMAGFSLRVRDGLVIGVN
jgi:hypothetical protein